MAEERTRRRLFAILAADVVGYSRLIERDESGTLAALKVRRKQVLEPVVAKHDGRIFKHTGDGFLVEFDSAVEAVQCAVELQHGMDAANGDLPEDRHIVMRIGINLGDVVVEGSDRYGDGVNIAARLEGIAEPGGIVVSGTTYDSVRNKVDAGFEDLGVKTLKNITGPVKTDTGYYIFRVNKITPGTKQSLEQSKQGIKQLLASQNQQKKLDSFSSNFRNEWRANTDCATEYVIPDCRNGRPPVPEAPAPTGKQPVKGSSGAAPPALDGTGAPLVGVSTGGTAIGQQSPAASGLGALGGAGAGPTQSAPLALGGAPSEEAGGAIPPGALGGGAGAPGGAAPTPVPGQ